ncbi:cobalamin B12-binding domain-containing protein [Ornithinimicrobium sufpigmenti]|uniref:cobalamin B12-binding domain-containing protein n=1 Tax=Ornithinimicrobium sufpigmenti TaxID=2508882 RepID=UPI001036A640|nr:MULTISPECIES: B12-binding domain-containing protein [unclassified Ornithinimicrobium]
MTSSSSAQSELYAALVGFDEARAVRVLEEQRERAGLQGLVGELVIPVMRQLGEGWARGKVTVAQEHLSTQLVRSYLDSLRRPPVDEGPQAWLACPPRELHDLPLLALGLLLWEQGWQIRFFGASTPLHDLLRGVRIARPELVVISGDEPRWLLRSEVPLGLIAAETTLALGGRAAQSVGARLPGTVLPPDVVMAAQELGACVLEARAG